MAYLLDANVFIQAKNLHYGLDFCPAFWDWIDTANGAGTVLSIDRVAGELLAVSDELADWARPRRRKLFLQTDDDSALLPSLHAVATWAADAPYQVAAVYTFLQKADYYLVAYAHAHGHAVVTHEVGSAGHKKIKIPDACRAMGAASMTPFAMLRAERARFVLDPPTGPSTSPPGVRGSSGSGA